MKTKQALKYLGFFMVGVFTAGLLGAGLFLTQSAGVNPFCISTAATVTCNIGTMSDGQFTLIYQVPSCILSGGLHIESVSKFNAGSIRADYKK
jgi:hypothetical protein